MLEALFMYVKVFLVGGLICLIAEFIEIKTKITPAYRAKCYDLTKVHGTYVARRMFNEDAVFYDIKERNKVMAGKIGDDDDDDDDLF